MLLLRIGRKARWEGPGLAADDPESVAQAALDLQLAPGEAGLSVFRVEGGEDSAEVAVLFALTCRDRPSHVDFVVFPGELAVGLGLEVAEVPVEGLEPNLNARHHEIFGLTPDSAQRLAGAILSDPARLVGRVRDRDLPALGAAICRRNPATLTYLSERWAATLAPLLDDPRPES